MQRLSLSRLALMLSLLGPTAAAADEDPWALCKPSLEPLPQVRPPADERPGAIRLSADQAHLVLDGVSLLEGRVAVGRGEQTLYADRVHYDHPTGRVDAEGRVLFTDPDISLYSDRARWDLNSGQGWLGPSRFRHHPMHGRGEAQEVRRREEGVTLLERATYTTCDPGDGDWLLSARRLRLDDQAGQGTGRDVVLRFKHVPLFYSPWISFPIDDRRKSGFLAPRISASSSSGFELETPYYLNLAPNYDATLSPRYMEQRGLQLKSELRYLGKWNQGTVEYEILPGDRSYGDTRQLISLNHSSAPTGRLRMNLRYNEVSDSDYFEDLGGTLAAGTISFLERRVDATYGAQAWDLHALIQDYQTIDTDIAPESRPYQRVPRLVFNGATQLQALRLGLYGEYVRFRRPDTDTGSGVRLDLMSSLALPLERSGYFLRPRLSLRHTQYDLSGFAEDADTSPARSLPILSLDAGLIFERRGTSGALQTLEPRLFYLYAPYRDQSGLPVFDTGRSDFNYDLLFAEDRFNGADRVGDANRLSAALTTRRLDPENGRELYRLTLGQMYYFEDRRVTLPGEAPAERTRSPLVAQFEAFPAPRWRLRAGWQWDPKGEQTELAAAQVQYRRDSRHLANLAYRDRPEIPGQEGIEQLDASFAWRLNRRWTGIGRWAYSLREQRDVSALAGLEYESCCWALQVVWRKYVSGGEDDYNSGIYFQLVLKGLTKLGQSIDALLEQDISGYEARY